MVYLLERGLDGAYAARALAVAGFLTPLGMVGFSWLADRGGRRLAAILAYGCSILGVGALALVRGPGDDVWLWLYVLLFGGSMGSRGPMISTLATLRYRGAHFGRIYGLISIGMGLGGFFGAWIGGLLHDLDRRLCRGDDPLGRRARARRRLARLGGRRARAAQPLEDRRVDEVRDQVEALAVPGVGDAVVGDVGERHA